MLIVIGHMPLSPQRRHFIAAILFALLHYAATAAIVLLMLASIGSFDRPATPLSELAASIPQSVFFAAFYILLLPLGFLPLGPLYNSAALGYGVYWLLGWLHERKITRA